MKKLSLKILSFVVVGVVVISAACVLALSVKPVRTILEGTFFPHDESDHDETTISILQVQVAEVVINPTAAKNIGLDDSAVTTIEVIDFYKSLSFPAVVVERPGFSSIMVPSPVSGVVTKIYHETGVAVAPGESLFDILLNQQELVKAQTEFLALLRKREINTAELKRLADLDAQIVPKQRRELDYEKIQLDSEIEIQKNVLLLQGLRLDDITDSLEKDGKIIRNMTVFAPPFENDENIASAAHADDEEHIFTVDELFVSLGKNVVVGDSLCRLTDYCKLAIQGKVFAVNEKELDRALTSKGRVTATFEGNGSREIVKGLVLRSIDNKMDSTSGTLFCYVDLKNRFTEYEVNGENHQRRYTKWHFKPGQRCELNIEYEPLPNCIVLPVDAVAKDFQEMCVFEWVGNEDDQGHCAGGNKIWRKKPVHVIYQTKDAVAIANDGSIFPGARVAVKGASFILAALETANQNVVWPENRRAVGSGGGVQHGDHVH